MLKIKSNTNEFTIIFLRRLERKRMLKRSCSASQISVCLPFWSAFVQFNASLFFFSFCFSVFSFFLLLFSTHLFFFLVPHSLFYFRHVALLSSAQNIIFSPKCFCFNPRYFFSSAQKSLPICGSAPPSFCFFSSCLSFLPLATTYCPFSTQVFNSKPFSATSCLFI